MTFLTIDIQSNIEQVIEDSSIYFYREIPYALAVSINDTLFETRRLIVDTTWQKAFRVRNTVLPRAMFRVDKISLGGATSQLRAFKNGSGSMGGMIYQRTLPRTSEPLPWVEWHTLGGTKRPQMNQGGQLAIPADPETLRSPTGRIRKPNKPMNITNKRKHFIIKKGGEKKLIAKRVGDDIEPIYYFKRQAKIRKQFRFYEDGMFTIEKVWPGRFVSAFNAATWKSPYKASG